ncbi:pseudouridine synthase [Novosphingobium profundi]|uniref:pseudouridine synthase n=1 Tax=Novosphingobium profundi TaxID=1774954 RepID=UPI001FEC5DD2|nr:pseudouridine synthase [Novosphingobium profundi]
MSKPPRKSGGPSRGSDSRSRRPDGAGRGTSERGRPERSSSGRSRPERGTSERARPERGTSERARPERGSFDRARPERGSSDRARPERGSSDRVRPERGSSDRARPERGSFDRARPERGSYERRRSEDTRGQSAFSERRGGAGSRPRSFGKAGTAGPTPKDPNLPEREGERIAKLLARAGIASRREVERMIAEGRVKLGEDVITTPATVLTSLAGITVDGNPVKEADATRLFAFHKPAGLITAERDPAGRPTIYNALRNALPADAGRVMPVGRLDFNTEGLLLLTNDGEFKRALELPSTGIPRTYRARAFGEITQDQLESLIEGVEIDGVRYGKIDANLERGAGLNRWIEMTLTEGKNREVRRVLEHFGLQVSRLIRVGYGPFALDELPKGAAVEIEPKVLERFRREIERDAK